MRTLQIIVLTDTALWIGHATVVSNMGGAISVHPQEREAGRPIEVEQLKVSPAAMGSYGSTRTNNRNISSYQTSASANGISTGKRASFTNAAGNITIDQGIIDLMLPQYYDDAEMTQEYSTFATRSWQAILDDEAPGFLASNRDDNRHLERNGSTLPFVPSSSSGVHTTETTPPSYTSAVTMFYDLFYKRLFDIHPVRQYIIYIFNGLHFLANRRLSRLRTSKLVADRLPLLGVARNITVIFMHENVLSCCWYPVANPHFAE
jgi:hypothetical protein